MALRTTLFALALCLVVVQRCTGADDPFSIAHGEEGVTCKLQGNDPQDQYLAYGTAYFASKGKMVAAEFGGNQVQCCYLSLPVVVPTPPKRWRDDAHCGGGFNDQFGEPAICDPDGVHHCCSRWHWCGYTSGHCNDGGVDYSLAANRPAVVVPAPRPFNVTDYAKLMKQEHPCTAPDGLVG